ncbi:MAG: glycoside hydrolase family 43 protein [Janthinobacterium lividum]
MMPALRTTALLAFLLVVAACSATPGSAGTPTTSVPQTLTNPALGQGADPFVVFTDGQYHQITSSSGGNGVAMRSATSLATLSTAPEQELFRGGSDGSPCCEWWAPEVHQIGGRWYVYVAADDGDNNHHRTYVLSADKITGPYGFDGQLRLPGDRWAIDATVFTLGQTSYVVWSGWPGAKNGEQDLYISRLDSPTTVTGRAVRISRPQLDWETHAGSVGVLVNEGPAALVSGGRVFLTYSGSGCWTPQYALGMLTADATADLLDPASWTKSPAPVFAPAEGSGLYGTGHNNFFTSPDGKQTWIVYHAVTNPEGSCGDDREVYAQPIGFAPDGTPQLGTPSAADVPLPSGDPGR